MAKKQAVKPAGKGAKTKAKQMTKSAVFQELAEKTELPRKKVAEVFDKLYEIIQREVGKKGPGVFTVPPGLVRLTRKVRGPTKERMGTRPGTTEPMLFPAKPATTKIRPTALRALKSLAES
jgi:nucleoid DNA-binding protein